MTDMGHQDLPDYADSVKPLTPAEAVAQMLWLIEPDASVPNSKFFSQGHPVPR